ncbi:MAG TPA: aminotransferase class V-fold PLP-dependent enzyme [Casimicrobiaceae bacterium]|nr:aminotransferase class V-fold PLP-dependent enzyme [Casimicrobiaceae bacterium]
MAAMLPALGLSREEIFARMKAFSAGDIDWRRGRSPLYVFKANDEIAALGRDAFVEFFTENALGGKRAFFGLKKMEDEVVAIGLALFRAPEGAQGYFTTGGSESIVGAVKACRDFARAQSARPDRRGNIVAPYSAHPAFTKAARLMDLELRRVPVARDYRADAAAMARSIDADTLLLVGSAPCFSYGTVDPIAELGRLAQERSLWLHVDACVGGYLAPFARRAGYAVPEFDFSVPGVTSISADLHKFGFCPKPASTVFYRTADRAACQPFATDDWPGGMFATATLVGTRPGGAVAGAWATLHAMGEAGYVATARDIMELAAAYRRGVEATGFAVLGKPDLSILAFAARDADTLRVAEAMASRGWLPGLVRHPPALHLMLSMLHAQAKDDYLRDLADSLAEARSQRGEAKLDVTY